MSIYFSVTQRENIRYKNKKRKKNKGYIECREASFMSEISVTR